MGDEICSLIVTTKVFNLATREERIYWCAPFTALVCAYAQFTNKDFNTWMYAKYYPLVNYTRHTYLLGDWTVLHEQETTQARPEMVRQHPQPAEAAHAGWGEGGEAGGEQVVFQTAGGEEWKSEDRLGNGALHGEGGLNGSWKKLL